jgi:hypothetical protein
MQRLKCLQRRFSRVNKPQFVAFVESVSPATRLAPETTFRIELCILLVTQDA